MASNYPTSLDNFTNPTSNDSLNSPSHSLQHADVNDAIEAIEAKLGIGASPAGSATSGYVLTAGTGGTTTWSAPSVPGLTQLVPASITKGASGSASVSASGLVTFTGTESIALNSCFSSTYDHYKIIFTITTGSTSLGSLIRLRSGTTDNSSSNYFWNRVYSQSSTVVSQGNTSAETSFNYMAEFSVGVGISDINVYFPYATQNTSIQSVQNFRYTSFYQHSVNASGQMTVTTSYDGINFIATTGNFTGTIAIYGFKKD